MTTERTTDWLSEPGVSEAIAEGEARDRFNPERLAAAVHTLTLAVAELNTAAMGSEVLPVTDLIALLDGIRTARQDTATIESLMETRTARAMVDADLKDTEIDGVGQVTWRVGKSRKEWAHDALARDVIDHHMHDTGGEAPDPYTVRDWLLSAAAVSYWRVTHLRELGLDPEDYCVSVPGKVSVQIMKPGSRVS